MTGVKESGGALVNVIRDQGTRSKAASCGVVCRVPIKLRGAELRAQVPLKDAGTRVPLRGV